MRKAVKHQSNQMLPEAIGLSAIPYVGNNSGQRYAMGGGQQSQILGVLDPDEPILENGILSRIGEYVFDVRMPKAGTIKYVIPKYIYNEYDPATITNTKLTETLIIYEVKNAEGLPEYDGFILPLEKSLHVDFGFSYKKTPEYSNIRVGAYFNADTVFLTPHSLGENGAYNNGIRANVAIMSLPGTYADAMIVSESFAKRTQFETFKTITADIDSSVSLLNLYGDADIYKVLPNIGSVVGHDGILFATRKEKPGLNAAYYTKKALRTINELTDTIFYAAPGSTILSIDVIKNAKNSSSAPEQITKALDTYANAYAGYHHRIINAAFDIQKTVKAAYGPKREPIYSPTLHNIIEGAYPRAGNLTRINDQPVSFVFKKKPLGSYRIIIRLRKTSQLYHNKITGDDGDKGMIVETLPDARMPRNHDGVVADVILDPKSLLARTIMSKPFVIWISAAARDISRRFRTYLGMPKEGNFTLSAELNLIDKADPSKVDMLIDEMLSFYKCVSTLEYNFFIRQSREDLVSLLANVLTSGLQIKKLTSEQTPGYQAAESLMARKGTFGFAPTKGKLTFVGYDGNLVTTREPMTITASYLHLLEKTGLEGGSCNTPLVNTHGLFTQRSDAAKNTTPVSTSGQKFTAETELRQAILGACGAEAYVVLSARSTNLRVIREMSDNILKASTPGNIQNITPNEDMLLEPGSTKQSLLTFLEVMGIKVVNNEGIA